MLLEVVEGHPTAYGCCKRHKLASQNPIIAYSENGLVPHGEHYVWLFRLVFGGPGGDWREGGIMFEEERVSIAPSKYRLHKTPVTISSRAVSVISMRITHAEDLLVKLPSTYFLH